jgi:hypothetical protein
MISFLWFRAAVDAVRKLDEGLKKKRAYREVFHQDAVGLRYKYILAVLH